MKYAVSAVLFLCFWMSGSRAIGTEFLKMSLPEKISFLQTHYAQQFSDHPIIIFDREEIEQEFYLKQAFGKRNQAKRNRIIVDYVRRKVGFELTENEAAIFEPYLTEIKLTANAVPIARSRKNSENVPLNEICGVFPATANTSPRLVTNKNLQLAVEEVYGSTSYGDLKSKPDFLTQEAFSLVHELGHCLDTQFMPELNTFGADSHDVHESESFAETMALFILANEGYRHLGHERAFLRGAYAHNLGHYFANQPSQGNEHYNYAGVIYFLAPALKEAQNRIDLGFEANSITAMKMASQEIVESQALDIRGFTAIYKIFQGHDRSAVVKQYKDYAESMPDIFKKSYVDLLWSLEFMPRASSYFFKKENVEPQQASGKILPTAPSFQDFEVSDFCKMEWSEVIKKYYFYQKQLRSGRLEAVVENKHASALDSFFVQMQTNCH